MLDYEQQANQAQALVSLDDDWHLLEGERTTYAIFFFPFLVPSSEGAQKSTMSQRLKFKSGGAKQWRIALKNIIWLKIL